MRERERERERKRERENETELVNPLEGCSSRFVCVSVTTLSAQVLITAVQAWY